mgnify:CR=1 FL=1
MATFITVSDGDAQLLRRNREQVQGNRLRKVEGDEQNRAASDIRAIRAQQPPELIPARRPARLRRDEPAAALLSTFNLVVVELFWQDGKDYDLNIGRNGEFVGWYFSVREDTAVNDGTLWNQLFWLQDNTSEGPASEFAVFDSTREPTAGSNYPVGGFTLELFSYCYEQLSTQPLTVTIYPVNVAPEMGYNPSIGLEDVQRLKTLGQSRLQSFNVTVDRFNPQGEKGIKIGEVRFPGPRLLSVTT